MTATAKNKLLPNRGEGAVCDNNPTPCRPSLWGPIDVLYRPYTESQLECSMAAARMVKVVVILSWNSTGKIGRIGRHRAETHRHFNQGFIYTPPPTGRGFPPLKNTPIGGYTKTPPWSDQPPPPNKKICIKA